VIARRSERLSGNARVQSQCEECMAVLGHIPGGGVPAGTPIPTVELDLESIQPSPFQPRRRAAQTHIEALADSIRQVGLIEPICVRPLPSGEYQIIAGECRWRAAKLAGLAGISCRVHELTEDQAFVLALVENLQREDLSPLEEALSYQQMLDRGIARSRAAIARLVGVTRMRITQRMRLLELDPVTQEKLDNHPKVLTEYHGRLLWQVKDLPVRHRLASEAVEGRWSGSRLRVRVDEWLKSAEAEARLSGGTTTPCSYTISLPGFRLHVDLNRANLHHVRDALTRLDAKLRDAADVERRGSALAADIAPVEKTL